MICLFATFHVPNSKRSLYISISSKANYTFCTCAICWFTYSKDYRNKVRILSEDLLPFMSLVTQCKACHIKNRKTPQKTHMKHREAGVIVVLHWDLKQRCKQPTRCNNFRLLIFILIYFNLLYMFRTTNAPIFWSTFDCIYSFIGALYQSCIYSQKCS